jgi:transcription initiation factor TFIIH subunit 3
MEMESASTQANAAASAEMTSEGLLVLVIDTNPTHWFTQGGSSADRAGLQQLISSTLVFVNAYLLLHRSNRIVIIAAHAGKSAMLYPNAEQEDTSGSAEQAAKVNAGVMQRLQELSDTALDPAKPNQTAIAASLSRALCCKLSIVEEFVVGILTERCWLCAVINRAMNEEPDLRPRILVIQKSPDVSEHYIAIMNGIFSAQKKSVAVDACILATEQSSFMQQAAYL